MGDSLTFDFLDSVKYLYLRQLSEPQGNSLSIIVQEAIANPAAPVKAPYSGLSVIESTGDCQTFELTWNRYVAYLVTEEMVGSCGNYEAIQHFKLTCLNHLIDVAAYAAPRNPAGRSALIEPNPNSVTLHNF